MGFSFDQPEDKTLLFQKLAAAERMVFGDKESFSGRIAVQERLRLENQNQNRVLGGAMQIPALKSVGVLQRQQVFYDCHIDTKGEEEVVSRGDLSTTSTVNWNDDSTSRPSERSAITSNTAICYPDYLSQEELCRNSTLCFYPQRTPSYSSVDPGTCDYGVNNYHQNIPVPDWRSVSQAAFTPEGKQTKPQRVEAQTVAHHEDKPHSIGVSRQRQRRASNRAASRSTSMLQALVNAPCTLGERLRSGRHEAPRQGPPRNVERNTCISTQHSPSSTDVERNTCMNTQHYPSNTDELQTIVTHSFVDNSKCVMRERCGTSEDSKQHSVVAPISATHREKTFRGIRWNAPDIDAENAASVASPVSRGTDEMLDYLLEKSERLIVLGHNTLTGAPDANTHSPPLTRKSGCSVCTEKSENKPCDCSWDDSEEKERMRCALAKIGKLHKRTAGEVGRRVRQLCKEVL